ncbi:acetyltransferase [Bacillus sp. 1P06AnD]|uniref:acetyltransferase n=1 Tax=Bacillus sp. 1P06AnD TaxID=3132208 RepID=UPI00399FB9B9
MKQTCPSCGGDSVKKGILSAGFSPVTIHEKGNLRGKSSNVGAVYCSECGRISSLYVENPDIVGVKKPQSTD